MKRRWQKLCLCPTVVWNASSRGLLPLAIHFNTSSNRLATRMLIDEQPLFCHSAYCYYAYFCRCRCSWWCLTVVAAGAAGIQDTDVSAISIDDRILVKGGRAFYFSRQLFDELLFRCNATKQKFVGGRGKFGFTLQQKSSLRCYVCHITPHIC